MRLAEQAACIYGQTGGAPRSGWSGTCFAKSNLTKLQNAEGGLFVHRRLARPNELPTISAIQLA
jgi:hypothetical protein